jgi:hypothetical protein
MKANKKDALSKKMAASAETSGARRSKLFFEPIAWFIVFLAHYLM